MSAGTATRRRTCTQMHTKPQTIKLFLVIVALAALSAIAAGTASAAKSQLPIIEDPTRIGSPDPAQQDAALDEIVALGGKIVKVPIQWRAVAPDGGSTVKPGGDLSSPDAYPAGAWSISDRAITQAQARGLKVWIMITAPAPRWAVAKESTPGPGAYNPDPKAYGDFAEAVGRRYANVSLFSIWNEPNLSRFLTPQKSGSLVGSAIQYRDMYREAYAGLVASGHKASTIMFGELLPSYGNSRSKGTPPLPWLQEFFCLDKNNKPLKGKAVKSHKCTGYKKITASGFAYHPYSQSGGPFVRAPLKSGAAPIAYLKRIENVLDAAAKAHKLSKRKLKIYSSEFGFQSSPPDPYGTTMSKIPGFLNASEYLSWVDPRVATYSQYLILDDADLTFFQSGLRFANGTEKPGVYEAYQTPLMVFKGRTSRSIRVWGNLRAKPPGVTMADLQVKSGSSWTTLTQIPVSSGVGYFQRSINTSGAWTKTYRINWSGGISRSTKAGKQIKPYTN